MTGIWLTADSVPESDGSRLTDSGEMG